VCKGCRLKKCNEAYGVFSHKHKHQHATAPTPQHAMPQQSVRPQQSAPAPPPRSPALPAPACRQRIFYPKKLLFDHKTALFVLKTRTFDPKVDIPKLKKDFRHSHKFDP